MRAAPRHRFAGSAGTALVLQGGAALVGATADSPVVALLVESLCAGETLEQLATRLMEVGLSSLPAFGIVLVDGADVRLVQRGNVRITAITASREQLATLETPVITWREETVGGCDSILLSIGPSESSRPNWVTSGLVPASELEFTVAHSRASDPASPAAELLVTPDAESAAEDAGTVSEPEVPTVLPEQEQYFPDAQTGPAPAGVVERPPPSAASAPVPAEIPGPADDLDFSHLLERTVYRSVEEAAVRTEVHDSATPTPAPTPTPTDSTSGASHPTLIFGETTPGLTGPASNQPAVQATHCPNGHPNPPITATCRECDAAIVSQETVTIPRPSLGVLRFSTGETIAINATVLVGRTPPTDQRIDGHPAIGAAIDNPEISRWHATVHVNDWTVLVSDNGSTNGTRVLLPGKAPELCRMQERVPVVPGTIVDLGGVITFRYDLR